MTGARGLECDMVVFVGCVPKHGVTIVWGAMRGWGVGVSGLFGGERENRHTQKSEQTTKKWVADGARLDRWWGKTGGKDNQKSQSVVVDSLLSTTQRGTT